MKERYTLTNDGRTIAAFDTMEEAQAAMRQSRKATLCEDGRPIYSKNNSGPSGPNDDVDVIDTSDTAFRNAAAEYALALVRYEADPGNRELLAAKGDAAETLTVLWCEPERRDIVLVFPDHAFCLSFTHRWEIFKRSILTFPDMRPGVDVEYSDPTCDSLIDADADLLEAAQAWSMTARPSVLDADNETA